MNLLTMGCMPHCTEPQGIVLKINVINIVRTIFVKDCWLNFLWVLPKFKFSLPFLHNNFSILLCMNLVKTGSLVYTLDLLRIYIHFLKTRVFGLKVYFQRKLKFQFCSFTIPVVWSVYTTYCTYHSIVKLSCTVYFLNVSRLSYNSMASSGISSFSASCR